jgi:hypothetical protein
MATYTGKGAAAVGASLTLLTLISSTSRRPEIRHINFGAASTPADHYIDMDVSRFTAVGTEGSGWTPVAHDPADPASSSDCGVGAFSVEPTYTASSSVHGWSCNSRTCYQWFAEDKGLFAPATANNGLGIRSVSSGSSASHKVVIHFRE